MENSTEDFEATSWSGSNIDSEDESPDHGHSPDNINFFSADGHPYQDISFDPKIVVSDHESDEDPSTVGYNDYDTDEEANHAAVEIEAEESVTSRIELDVSTWCKCGHCVTMQSEIECYCCKESSLICDTVLSDTEKICVTNVSVFKKTIEDREILELHSNGQRGISRDGEGKIKAEGFRHVDYSTFLQICSLRFSCLVRKIRELYPAPDGNCTDFEPDMVNSRI